MAKEIMNFMYRVEPEMTVGIKSTVKNPEIPKQIRVEYEICDTDDNEMQKAKAFMVNKPDFTKTEAQQHADLLATVKTLEGIV